MDEQEAAVLEQELAILERQNEVLLRALTEIVDSVKKIRDMAVVHISEARWLPKEDNLPKNPKDDGVTYYFACPDCKAVTITLLDHNIAKCTYCGFRGIREKFIVAKGD